VRRLPPEVIAIALIVATAALASLAVSLASGPPGRLSASATPTPVSPTPVPSVIAGPLDGLPTPRQLAVRRPVAVVVDNFYPDARPQFGIGRASVVYETLVEGGITRLLAIFLERSARRVGPIRSARPYFVKWAAPYHALFVHAGDSPAAQQLLRGTPKLRNVDALLPHTQFHRVRARAAPHNLFGSTQAAYSIARRKGWNLTARVPALPHKPPAPTAQRGPGRSIHLDFSTPSVASPSQYAVTYQYDRKRNAYLRLEGGAPVIDALTESQIEPKNVVVLVTRIAPIVGDPQGRVHVRVIGRGRAFYLRDGRIVWGHWTKRSRLDPIHFWNNKGRKIAFDPGLTWIDIVPPGAVRIGR
jgi:hypothetical protein